MEQCGNQAIRQENDEKNSPKSRNYHIYKQSKDYIEHWVRRPDKTWTKGKKRRKKIQLIFARFAPKQGVQESEEKGQNLKKWKACPHAESRKA